MLGTAVKFGGMWLGVTIGFALIDTFRTGHADWWQAAFLSAVILSAGHFYGNTVDRLDRIERDLRRLQNDHDQLTADFHHHERRQRLDRH